MRALISVAIACAALAGCAPDKPEGADAGAKSKPGAEAATPGAPASVRLYVMECGAIDVLDLGVFDRGGAYAGQQKSFVDTCYLIRHAKGDLVWDAGLPDALAETPGGVVDGPFRVSVPKTLASQLAELDLAPADIEYFSASHSHFDHVGNANLFAGSTFIVQKAERAHMFRPEARADTATFAAYSALETAKTLEIDGDHDVFGDGSATIVSLPGHTPGHSSLLVKLENSGPFLLSGDLYHFTEARERRTIPTFNTDAEETLRSMDKFEALASETGAWVMLQHEPADYAKVKHSPEYLD